MAARIAKEKEELKNEPTPARHSPVMGTAKRNVPSTVEAIRANPDFAEIIETG